MRDDSSEKKNSDKSEVSFRFWKFFVVLLCIGGGIFGTLEYRYQKLVTLPNSGDEQLTLFEIETGSMAKNIATELEEQNFILSAWAFERYAKRKRIAENFQAGRFYLAQDLTISEVSTKLLNAKKREEFFTIPEGLTLEEIDARILKKGYADENTFLNCVREICDFSQFEFLPEDRTTWEGYFFPETYAVFPENFSAELLAKKMLQEFEKRAEKLGILEKDNLNEIVIMASMIEKESRRDEERPIISGILWKRLENGWILGVDATVRYFTGKKTEPLTMEDLETDNPYNTRLHSGLPPTAIGNPGEASLQAAMNPEKTEYFYYLHGKDGEVHYAVTNEEHNRNKGRYL